MPVGVIAFFASVGILAGALVQIPVGYLSDRMDRRIVLIGIAGVAIAVEALFIAFAPTTAMWNLVLSGFFGAAIYSMYPVIIAHANDHAEPGTSLQISGGLLMLYGFGAIVGPLLSGFAIGQAGPTGMFMATLGAHGMLVIYALLRIRRRADPAAADKGAFQTAPIAASSTPQTAALALDADVSGADLGDELPTRDVVTDLDNDDPA